MADDASLDDFLDAADQEVDPEAPADEVRSGNGRGTVGDDDQRDATEPAGRDESPALDQSAVEPAVTTLDWTPGGAACEACEEVVERRWRDDGVLVCESCKDW